MRLAVLLELAFDDAEEIPRRGLKSHLFADLALERLTSRLAELDVSAREIRIAFVLREAEEDFASDDTDTAGNRLNVFLFAHD